MSSKKNKTQIPKKKSAKIEKISLKDLPVWMPAIFFLITTIIFFWDILLQNSYFWEDFIEYVYPVQFYAAVESAAGSIPFWNPFSFMGMPFFADLQVGFFYPLNRLLTLFVSDGNLSVLAIELFIIIHFFIAQLSIYLLARYFKISSYGAIISSVSYAFSLLLICHVIHPMIVFHLAWLPLIILFFIMGISENKISKSIIAGLLLGMVMLSGHPQTTLYVGLLLALAFIWMFAAGVKSGEIKGKLILTQLMAGILPVIIAFCIFSIQYLPSQILAEQSQRDIISYEKASEGSIEFKNIYTSIVPNIFGEVSGDSSVKPTYYQKFNGSVQNHFYWETAYYFGIVALILGIFSAIRLYKKRYISFLIFLIFFAFLFALGRDGVLFNLMYNLPYFGTFRNPARIMFFAIFAFSILAGFGFDELWKNIKDKSILKTLLIASLLPFLISFFTAVGFIPKVLDAPKEIISDISVLGTTALVFVIITFAFSIGINRKLINPSFGAILLIITAFIDLSLAGGSFNNGDKNPEEIYRLQPELKSEFLPNSFNDLFRVNTRIYKPVSFSAMQRNQGLIDRIHQVEGYNPLVLKKAAIYSFDEKTSFDISNVKYQVKVNMQNGSWNYVERNSFMPRAWFVYSTIVKPPDQIIDYLKTENIDYKNSVLLSVSPKIKLSGKQSSQINNQVECTFYSPNEIIFNVSSSESGILCISEIWYPDWKAFVDDKEVDILQAFNSFRAVELSSGNHTVKLEYDSAEFKTGSLISVLTLFLSLVAVFLLNRLENKRNNS